MPPHTATNGHGPAPAGLLDRLPPQNLEAEMGTLGSALLDNGVLPEIVLACSPEDFYRDSHQEIARTIWAEHADGRPVDGIFLREALIARGSFEHVGGTETIAQILSVTPHAANGPYYAGIVREKAIIRRLIEAANQVLRDAYGNTMDAATLLERAERSVFQVGAGLAGRSARPIGEHAPGVMERYHARLGGAVYGLPTGFQHDVDARFSVLRPSEMTVLAARPSMGKTALLLNLCEHVAIVMGLPALLVSLEMTADALAERLVISRGHLSGQVLQQGIPLDHAGAERLNVGYEAARDARIWVDDAASRNVSQIASVARLLRAREGIALVAVDYLQLIAPAAEERRGSSRQEQVAWVSSGLKQLARELKIPVLVAAQLNRAAENRDQHRPRMSDLRECLAADTTIYDASSGRLRTVGDYVRGGHNLVGYSLDDREPGRPWAVHRTIGEPFWSTGVRPVFRVRTATGRVVRCTANHPFRALSGWKPLEELAVGQRVAVPRSLPEPIAAGQSIGLHADEARLLGYLISDGSYLAHRSVGYVKADPALVADVVRIVRERFGIEARPHPCKGDAEQVELTAGPCGPGGNPLIEWLKRLGIHGQKGHEKRVPPALLACRNAIVAEFLGCLWAGDGCVVPRKRGGWVLKFTSTSPLLLAEIQMLLLRLGIVAIVGNPGRNSKSTRDIATLSIGDARSIVRFQERIALPGVKGERLARAAEDCRAIGENSRLHRLPLEVNELVTAAKDGAGHSWRTLGYRVQGKEMAPDALAAVAARLGDSALAALAESDVLWDRIESIEPDGEAEVFDVRVPSLGNFVAGGVFVHNSGAIEQDADTILLLHRPDYYDPDDQPGLAELIVAKNRNGPTGTAKLRYVKEQMRFCPQDDAPWSPPAPGLPAF
jgi:replicative DNA helicase